jgi:Putative addiction module component
MASGSAWVRLVVIGDRGARSLLSKLFLKVEISQLSIAERIQLAEDLWDSIIDRQDEVELDLTQQQELDES